MQAHEHVVDVLQLVGANSRLNLTLAPQSPVVLSDTIALLDVADIGANSDHMAAFVTGDKRDPAGSILTSASWAVVDGIGEQLTIEEVDVPAPTPMERTMKAATSCDLDQSHIACNAVATSSKFGNPLRSEN
jgi:hypothetical protein